MQYAQLQDCLHFRLSPKLDFMNKAFIFLIFKGTFMLSVNFFIFISTLHVLRVVEPRIHRIINYLPYIFIIGEFIVDLLFHLLIYLNFLGFIFLFSNQHKKSLIYV